MGRSAKSAAQPKPRPAKGRRRGAAGVSPPNVCLLSNGRYNVMLTQAGSGYSSCGGVDVTRWREDATGDCWGQYCYIRDIDGGRVWSAGRQPLGGDADDYEAILGSDRAVFRRRDADIETRYEVAVATDANAEVRRITLTNHGVQPRTLEVTSYAEIALNDRRADQAHPAFAKLFLQTEYLPTPPTLVYRRRPRARDQKPIWALHVLAGPEDAPARPSEPWNTRPTGPGSWDGAAPRLALPLWTPESSCRGPSGRSWTPFSACAARSGSTRAHPPSLPSSLQRQSIATMRWRWPTVSVTWPK